MRGVVPHEWIPSWEHESLRAGAIAAARSCRVSHAAAALSAATPALIRALYPPERLGRGLGFYALAVGVGLTAGPTVASAVLAVADWPWLFLINVPVGGASLLLAIRAMPADRPGRRPLDPVSALLCMAFFVLMLLGLAEAGDEARPLRLEMSGGAMGRLDAAILDGRRRSFGQMVEANQFWAFNGTVGMTPTPLAELARDEPVHLAIRNDTAFPHAMHLHGMHFREIAADGTLGPLRDTTLLQRGETRETICKTPNVSSVV